MLGGGQPLLLGPLELRQALGQKELSQALGQQLHVLWWLMYKPLVLLVLRVARVVVVVVVVVVVLRMTCWQRP